MSDTTFCKTLEVSWWAGADLNRRPSPCQSMTPEETSLTELDEWPTISMVLRPVRTRSNDSDSSPSSPRETAVISCLPIVSREVNASLLIHLPERFLPTRPPEPFGVPLGVRRISDAVVLVPPSRRQARRLCVRELEDLLPAPRLPGLYFAIAQSHLVAEPMSILQVFRPLPRQSVDGVALIIYRLELCPNESTWKVHQRFRVSTSCPSRTG